MSGQDKSSAVGDPKFVSATDLHLQSSSPALNQGVPVTGFTVDFDGDPRHATTPDRGADEVLAPAANGAPCTASKHCKSGFCADSVCCNTACGGGAVDCMACSVAAGAAADGTCAPAKSGTTCRASAGTCDATEVCNGISTACPGDAVMPPVLVCRPQAGPCDQPDKCDGKNKTCPGDKLEPAGVLCRPPVNECDAPELCTDGAIACPTNQPQPDGTPCLGGTGKCVNGTCVLTSDAGPPPDLTEVSAAGP